MVLNRVLNGTKSSVVPKSMVAISVVEAMGVLPCHVVTRPWCQIGVKTPGGRGAGVADASRPFTTHRHHAAPLRTPPPFLNQNQCMRARVAPNSMT